MNFIFNNQIDLCRYTAQKIIRDTLDNSVETPRTSMTRFIERGLLPPMPQWALDDMEKMEKEMKNFSAEEFVQFS